MKSLDEFLPYVLPDVAGCPEVAALGAINSAAIEFCERSLVLQRDHDPITVIAGLPDYDLEAPTGMLVCKVMKAWFNHRVITPTTPDDMDDPTVYNQLIGKSQGTPLNYIQKDERTISLWPIPLAKVSNALTLRVALKPTRAAVSVDDVLFEDWVDVISAGAKAALQITPGKPFTNPQFAGANQAAFLAGINRAMVKANKGHTRANLSVRMIRI